MPSCNQKPWAASRFDLNWSLIEARYGFVRILLLGSHDAACASGIRINSLEKPCFKLLGARVAPEASQLGKQRPCARKPMQRNGDDLTPHNVITHRWAPSAPIIYCAPVGTERSHSCVAGGRTCAQKKSVNVACLSEMWLRQRAKI
eukprot:7384357-Prymnesium_polylepis.1